MTAKLLSSGIWQNITAAVEKCPDRCHVAVAYFGNGASKQLPLREGSTLIVDMSEGAVKSGQTKPSEVLKLIRRGVNVHSVGNLHAKVFVIAEEAFIGSTNVSHNSANNLVEAAVQTNDKSVVVAGRRFVKSLQGEIVTPEQAKRLGKLYKPPKIPPKPPQHSPLWIVPLDYRVLDEEDNEQKRHGLPIAKSQIRSSKLFDVEEFFWSGKAFLDRLKNNDLLMQVVDEGNGRQMVVPASRVVHIQRYKKGFTNYAIVFLEKSKGRRSKNLKHVITRLGPRAKELGKLNSSKLLRNPHFVHDLLNLWSLSIDN